MSPRILQDIVPQKRPEQPKVAKVSETVPKIPEIIQEVPETKHEPAAKKLETPELSFQIRTEVKPERKNTYPNLVTKSKSYRSLILIFMSAIVVIVGAIIIVNKYFSYAHVYVSAKNYAYNFDKEEFTARKDDNTPLHFEIMIVDGENSESAVFTDSKDVSTKAIGDVVIYNKFSTTAQKLLINTKLSDDKKHIYTTNKEVTIPGYTTLSGKVVPGSVTVGITAAGAGPEYNGDPRDFSIVGFAGTAKASKIYARSSTPLTGGESGQFYVLSAQTKGEAIANGGIALYNKLMKKFLAQVPPGYMAYPGSMQFTKKLSDDVFQSKTSDGIVTISGTLSAPIFKKSEVLETIIHSAYPEVKDKELAEISSPKMDSLTFEYSDPTTTISKTTDNVKFKFSGEDTLVWHPDIELLKSKLSGAKVDDLNNIFNTDPGIYKATAKFTPPWQNTVPNNLEHIKITVE